MSAFTEKQARELVKMGFTIGSNGAYLLGKDGAPAYFIWQPGTLPKCRSDAWVGDASGGLRSAAFGVEKKVVEFDDPLAAAVYLIMERG
jgi:hypothetical protein